jgi:hypothetical protein
MYFEYKDKETREKLLKFAKGKCNKIEVKDRSKVMKIFTKELKTEKGAS